MLRLCFDLWMSIKQWSYESESLIISKFMLFWHALSIWLLSRSVKRVSFPSENPYHLSQCTRILSEVRLSVLTVERQPEKKRILRWSAIRVSILKLYATNQMFGFFGIVARTLLTTRDIWSNLMWVQQNVQYASEEKMWDGQYWVCTQNAIVWLTFEGKTQTQQR